MEAPFVRRPQSVSEVTSTRTALRRVALGLSALGWLVASAPAFAGDPPPPPAGTPSEADMNRAKELFDNGQILYDEGRYDDAITAWEQAYRLSGLSDLLFNISGAYERIGKFNDALAALNRYRVFAPASERETLDRRMRTLEERMKTAEAAPKPIDPPTTPVETTAKPPPATEPAKPKRAGPPVAPIGVAVVGLGAIAYGTVEGLRASGAVSSLNDQCVAGANGLLCPAGARDASATRAKSSVTAAAALGAGGLLTAGGLVWLVVAGNSSSDLRLTPTIGGLTLDGEF
jgi:tetratricopeptide (TPR) repeat protein